MDFELSEDQLALRDGARELLDGLAPTSRVRGVVEAGGGYDAELWAAMVEQGWTALELPESSGGLGLGTVETAVLLEEVGRHVAPAPFLSTVLALGALHRAGHDERVGDLLATGSIACIAWSAARDAVRAARDGDAWVLSGRPDPTLYAPSASLAVVFALDGDDVPGLFAVDLDAVDRPAREPAIDQTRELGWLTFDRTPAVRLGGADAVDTLLDRGAAGLSAEMLGSASRALDMAVEYAKDRVQFGRPIGSFQAVKHRCADMLVDVEGMRSTAYWAAWCIGADDPDASVSASTAKVWCSDAGKRVMASALQVHGGVGFTWEHDLHLFLKRTQLDQLTFGDAAFHRRRLAAMLRPRVEAGESVI
ncbi:MAG TPA: acyl-CoA dehydrogenase family protein [Acidimicrobiia bacterium]|nr:acyl-CoA dehydrogenase family protein [Acidimicrobiia bacterium]